jgi:mRNA-degrading endonuclease RelE of RelBE toxin-antitoxin system
MDKIQKALNKLSSKERERIKAIIKKLMTGDIRGLDIKKLKGRDDIFRLRKGDLRVIYRLKGDRIIILAIERRSENTY